MPVLFIRTPGKDFLRFTEQGCYHWKNNAALESLEGAFRANNHHGGSALFTTMSWHEARKPGRSSAQILNAHGGCTLGVITPALVADLSWESGRNSDHARSSNDGTGNWRITVGNARRHVDRLRSAGGSPSLA